MIEWGYKLLSIPAVLIAITIHEYAHGYVAWKLGDPTAKSNGRLSLNPMHHLHPIGALMMLLVGFGWAKPVPVNPNNFRNYRKGCFWTSIAGVLTNYVMAFLFYPIFLLVVEYVCPLFDRRYIAQFLYIFFYALFACSLSFCVFNLLPLYPLDGFRIVDAVNTSRGKIYQFLRQNGYYILLGLILVHVLSDRIPYLEYVDVLGYVLNFAIDIFGKPITLFWEWILKPIIEK